MHTAHCTRKIAYCTLNTENCTLHCAHFTLHTAHYTLHTAHYTLNTAHFTQHTAHFTLHTTYCNQCLVHCTLHTTHCTLHTLHFTLYNEHSVLNTEHGVRLRNCNFPTIRLSLHIMRCHEKERKQLLHPTIRHRNYGKETYSSKYSLICVVSAGDSSVSCPCLCHPPCTLYSETLQHFIILKQYIIK